MTNYEKIKTLNIDEMAKFIAKNIYVVCDLPGDDGNCPYKMGSSECSQAGFYCEGAYKYMLNKEAE